MILRLEAGRLSLGLLPALGGAIAWLDWQRGSGAPVPLLRRADAAAIASGDPSRLACFPLVPFANRIAGSRFTFGGCEHHLPINRPPNPMAIHGSSFQAPWEVAEHGAGMARLVHRHRAAHAPFRYRAEQVFSLGEDGLRIALSVTHEGDAPMPYGIGLHPWFPRPPGTRLRLGAGLMLPPDADLLPTHPVPAPPPLAAGVAAEALAPFDACLAGWDGQATITWPDLGCGVAVAAGGAFGNAHLFVPPDRLVLCVEPVSHVPNVHNRPDLNRLGSLAVLEPGHSLRGEVTLSPVEA